jgi:hypothetical protein
LRRSGGCQTSQSAAVAHARFASAAAATVSPMDRS